MKVGPRYNNAGEDSTMIRLGAVLLLSVPSLGAWQASPQRATAGPACRNLATSLTHVSTAAGGFRSTVKTTCTFNPQKFQGNCTNEYSDTRGVSITTATTVVATYASLGDFIDEVRVVPPLFKARKATATTTGPTGRNSETTYTIDAQGRLTAETTAGTSTTTTYTEWDAAGRPTRVQDVGRGFNNTRTIEYDDVRRTKTTRVAPQGQGQVVVTTVETFDADGNPIRQTAGGGQSTSETTITVNATQRICR